MAYRASVIKSIQYGSVTLNNVTSGTATITSVTVANAFVQLLGVVSTPNDGMDKALGRVSLTNGTTVTANVNTATAADHVFQFVVTEFYGSVLKSATQEFAISIAGVALTGTATITAVSTTKTMLGWRGSNYDFAETNVGRGLGVFTLTNTTTITGTRATGTNTLTLYGTAVEFK